MSWKLIVMCLAPAVVVSAAALKDVEFARPGGVSLTLDGSIPDSNQAQKAVILVHGGGWEAGDKRTYIRPWFETLTKAGIAWFTINYRLAPQWKHPAAVEDIESAVRWVQANARRLGIDPRRIALMGESAGGHLVALAGLRQKIRVAAIIGFYGIYDLPLWFQQRGEVPRNIAQYLPDEEPETWREASPISYLSRNSPPMMLVHGAGDTGVPWRQSERLCTAAAVLGVSCRVMLIDDAPHGVENWEKEERFQIWKPEVVAWLNRTLQ
jgi:acetyl esterase